MKTILIDTLGPQGQGQSLLEGIKIHVARTCPGDLVKIEPIRSQGNFMEARLLEVIEADGQFEPLRGGLAELGIILNKCSREEHIPVAERRIRTLKERCRCICNTLPFKKLPGMLIVQMVSTCNFWLNV